MRNTYIPFLEEVYSLVKVKSLSRVQHFATPWTVAYQAPLSMEFAGQEYWSGLPFPSAGNLPEPASNPCLLHCRQVLYHLSHQGTPVLPGKIDHEILIANFRLKLKKVGETARSFRYHLNQIPYDCTVE